MPLSAPIRTLLRDHDCVIIPDFGGLIADYSPARIHPVRHTLAPPTKRVAFNQSLTRNDGLLVDALSTQLNLSTAQARQLIREAVARMQQELETGQRTELPGIGVFRRAVGRGLEFEYGGTDNLLNASFGLPELVARPVRATDALLSRERQPANPQLAAGRSRRTTRLLRGALAFVLVGLGLSANYMFADQLGYLPAALRLPESAPERSASVPGPAPVVTLRGQQAALATTDNFEAARPSATANPAPELPVAPPVPPVAGPAAKAKTKAAAPTGHDGQGKKLAKAAAKPAPKPPGWEKAAATNATPATTATIIKSRTGRFYVIAGSYTSMKNAEKGRQALTRLGHPARVITPPAGSRQYKLSVADFTDRTSADRQATILRKRMGNTLWVLNY